MASPNEIAFLRLSRAWERGIAAYESGMFPKANPYSESGNQHERDAWIAGYWSAHRDAMRSRDNYT